MIEQLAQGPLLGHEINTLIKTLQQLVLKTSDANCDQLELIKVELMNRIYSPRNISDTQSECNEKIYKLFSLIENCITNNAHILKKFYEAITNFNFLNNSNFLGKWQSILAYLIKMNEETHSISSSIINYEQSEQWVELAQKISIIDLNSFDQFIMKYFQEEQIDKFNYRNFNNQITHIDEEEEISTMIFTRDNKYLIAGYSMGLITVYTIEKGVLKLKQKLDSHLNNVKSLCYMNNRIFSGHFKGEIIVWVLNEKQVWTYEIKIQNHQKCVSSLDTNVNHGNLLFSGSYDTSIKIWKIYPSLTCIQTLNEHIDGIQTLSLNQSGLLLLTCSTKQIIIYTQQNSQWEFKQLLDISVYLCCFIWDLRCACFLRKQNTIQIYDFNLQQKQFLQVDELKIQTERDEETFYLTYNLKHDVLFVKSGNYLNFLYFQKNLSYKVVTRQLAYQNLAVQTEGNYFVVKNEKLKRLEVYNIIKTIE